MLSEYAHVVEGASYNFSFLDPAICTDSVPVGTFFHAPETVFDQMGMGTEHGRSQVLFATMTHADVARVASDFNMLSATLPGKRSVGLSLIHEGSPIDAPIAAMRQKDERTLEVVLYMHPKEAEVLI